jgi:hypothetical protein
MFDKDGKTVILLGKRSSGNSRKFSNKVLIRGVVHENVGKWIRCMLIKVEINTLSNEFRRNIA